MACGPGIRAGDEIIADGVQKMVRLGMSADEAADAPVIDDVVDVLDAALGLGIAALVVDPEVVRVGDVGDGVGERAEALRVHALADDAVLKRDVVAAAREAEAIPAAPFDAAMVKNHVAAAGKIDGAFALVAGDAFAEAQVADDDVVFAAEGNRAAVKRDAVAGRGRPVEGDVAADGDDWISTG